MMFSVRKEKSVKLKSFFLSHYVFNSEHIPSSLFIFRLHFLPLLVIHQIFSNIMIITSLHLRNFFFKVFTIYNLIFSFNTHLKHNTHFHFTYEETGTEKNFS